MKNIFILVVLLVVFNLKATTAQTQTQPAEKKRLVPGEQAPPADPGQKNFGGFRPAAGSRAQNGQQTRPPGRHTLNISASTDSGRWKW